MMGGLGAVTSAGNGAVPAESWPRKPSAAQVTWHKGIGIGIGIGPCHIIILG